MTRTKLRLLPVFVIAIGGIIIINEVLKHTPQISNPFIFLKGRPQPTAVPVPTYEFDHVTKLVGPDYIPTFDELDDIEDYAIGKKLAGYSWLAHMQMDPEFKNTAVNNAVSHFEKQQHTPAFDDMDDITALVDQDSYGIGGSTDWSGLSIYRYRDTTGWVFVIVNHKPHIINGRASHGGFAHIEVGYADVESVTEDGLPTFAIHNDYPRTRNNVRWGYGLPHDNMGRPFIP